MTMQTDVRQFCLFLSVDQVLQRIQMGFKSGFTLACHRILGIGFAADKGFPDHQEIFLFQCLQMAGQVSVSHVKKLLQGIEIDGIIDRKNGHDPQPDP